VRKGTFFMKGAGLQKSAGSATSDALLLIAIAGFGFMLVTGSGYSHLGSETGWRLIERTWERSSAAVTDFFGARWFSAPKPSTRRVESPETEPESYSVQAGDTLIRIAEVHGVTLDALVSINHIEDPDRLKLGGTILIPETDPTLREAARAPLVAPLQAEREIPVETDTEVQEPPAEPRGDIEIAADALDRLLSALMIEGWRDGFVGNGFENATWTSVAAAPPRTDLRAVDGLLALAEDELHSAYFENALETSQTALRMLEREDDPNNANPRRARLEVLRATAHTAFGHSRAAHLSFQRALESDPDLVLDSACNSPKVLHAFGEACLAALPDRELACRASGRVSQRPERAELGDRAAAQNLNGGVEPG
jgi:LysM repeat protein